MPAPVTREDLLDVVRKSELVPASDLSAFERELAEDDEAATPRDVASKLLNQGLITRFQADQFLQGKWRGFTIGKYKVLERLGSGGMGTVYLCEHLTVCRRVAIKVLPICKASNPSALGRFYREARAAGVLDHPNLVKAHDVDQDGELHFLVMDYVDGTSLQEIVARNGPFSILRACHYVHQAATGLLAAHNAGLIHRDVKPANILLERNGFIRVLDLGLARFYDDNVDLLTLKYDENNVLGTADYVAPEQAMNSHNVDTRCDIYSLGCTFYFLLTGRPPFPEGTIAQKLIWHQVRQPASVRQFRPDIPAEIETVLDRMMAKEPAKRFMSLMEVIQILEKFTRTPISPPPEKEMPRLSPAAQGQTTAPKPTGTLPRRSNQGVLIRPNRPSSSGDLVGLHRPPPPSELSTPHQMARATTTTEADHLRPKSAIVPEARLDPPPKPNPIRSSPGGDKKYVLLMVVFAILGSLLGFALTAWLFPR